VFLKQRPQWRRPRGRRAQLHANSFMRAYKLAETNKTRLMLLLDTKEARTNSIFAPQFISVTFGAVAGARKNIVFTYPLGAWGPPSRGCNYLSIQTAHGAGIITAARKPPFL
jgi:hypothetical protein